MSIDYSKIPATGKSGLAVLAVVKLECKNLGVTRSDWVAQINTSCENQEHEVNLQLQIWDTKHK